MSKDLPDPMDVLDIMINQMIDRGYDEAEMGPSLLVLAVKQAIKRGVEEETVIKSVSRVFEASKKNDENAIQKFSDSLDPADFLVFDLDTKTVKGVSHFSVNGAIVQINVESSCE